MPRTLDRTADPAYLVPALGGLYARSAGLGYALIRVVTGLWMVPHGAQKLFGWFVGDAQATAGFFAQIGLEPALPLVYLAGAVEFFGGLLLAVGLLTRPAAVATCVLMLVAAFTVHLGNGFFWTAGGYEYPLMWALLALGLAIEGGGRLSVDGRLGREF